MMKVLIEVTNLFGKSILKTPVGEVISNNGLSQLRAAETEKYPHPYIFSGGKESTLIQQVKFLV